MNRSAKLIIAAIGLLSVSATGAFAESRWDWRHPWRDEVNDRLALQNWRINHEFHEGELTPWQARRLHAEDQLIRREERDMAYFNHGYLTPAERRALNQQENAVGSRIPR